MRPLRPFSTRTSWRGRRAAPSRRLAGTGRLASGCARAYRALVVATVLIVCGLTAGASSGAVSRDRPAARPSLPATVPASPPKVIQASRISVNNFPGSVRQHALVPARLLGDRVFANSRVGFALALYQGITYPAITNDGGSTWRVSGPYLWVDAADAGGFVDQVGVLNARTFFAFGGGGYVVDTTSDGGKTWWTASLASGVLLGAFTTAPDQIIAISQPLLGGSREAPTPDWVYVSTDGGKVWRYNNRLGALPSSG
jgi:hypothetical protein